MKKRVKKISSILILLLFLLCLVGCNEVVPNSNSVTLSLDEKFYPYISTTVPSFTFSYEGNLNTIANVNKTYYTVFSNNEDDILSDALTDLFETYQDKMIVETVDTDSVQKRKYSHLDENGKLYNVDMVCDDGKVYDETAYIALDNGLKLSIDYCRFISSGKTYYTWRYSASISMYLYYPLMVVNDNGTKKIVLLTLPNCVTFKINPDQKVASLISKDTYLDETFYTFDYYESDSEGFDKRQFVLDYYKDYQLVDVVTEDVDVYHFKYLNNEFKLKLNESNFVITWLKEIETSN